MSPALGACAGLSARPWQAGEAWRSSGAQLSWVEKAASSGLESSAEGFHQLHGSIVLEGGKRRDT